jgi:hypothetical protein
MLSTIFCLPQSSICVLSSKWENWFSWSLFIWLHLLQYRYLEFSLVSKSFKFVRKLPITCHVKTKLLDVASRRKFLNVFFTDKNMGIIAYVRERHRSTVGPIHNSAERRQSCPDHPEYEAECQLQHKTAWSPWIASVWYMSNLFSLFYDCRHLCKKKQRSKMHCATTQGYVYVVLKISLWKMSRFMIYSCISFLCILYRTLDW